MDANYTVVANFAIDQRTLTASSTAGGSVTTPGEGAFDYNHGTNASIIASADLNYHFVNWTGTAVTAGKVASPSSASTTVLMDADYTVIANFEGDPPAAPTGLIATAGNGSVSLDWNDNNELDVNGYNVYRSTTQGSEYGQINGSLVAYSNYVDNDVNNGIHYYYVVTAVDDANNQSGYSNEASATPDYQDCNDVQAGGDGLVSDINGDCYVNLLDVEIIANYWLYTNCGELGDCENADLEPEEPDGDVDFFDFSDFAIDWLNCNEPQGPGCI